MAFGAGPKRQNSRRQSHAQRLEAAQRPVRASRRSTSQPSNLKSSRRSSPASRVTPLTPAHNLTSAHNNAKLRPLILVGDYPDWLRQLLQIQRGVWLGTIAVSSLALLVYSWSVYSQQQWGLAYQRLEQLRRSERQLVAGSEIMKNDIAQQIDPVDLGLAPQRPDNVIFLQPAAVKSNADRADENSSQGAAHKPSGY
jgi:hypothetical protein